METGRTTVRGPESGVRCQNSKLETRNAKLVGCAEIRISNFDLRLRTPDFGPRASSLGFTLIELMVVLTLILILASFAMPMYQLSVIHAREAVLRDDLFTMRKLIDEFTIDKQRPPTSLDELVDSGYLRGGIPTDPFTGSNQTWRTDTEDVPISADQAAAGIVDVHSGSEDTSLDGTPYSSW